MKSDTRKRAARNKPSAQVEDLVATDVNPEVVDAAYAEQLLAAAEVLATANVVATGRPGGADSTIKGSASEMSKSTTQHKKGNAAVTAVVLPAQCTMRDAADLKSKLLSQMDSQHAVPIDVSGLERIDAAAMQVLLAFVHDREQQNYPVEWRGTNQVIMDAASALGLTSLLKLPQVEAAA